MKNNGKPVSDFALTCPLPINDYPQVLMAHGGGGLLMRNLIGQMFTPSFDNPLLNTQHDGAVFQLAETRLAFTTDSYVVQPLFFPGGDIGSLAVHGTVNDLAMCGARPLYLSLGLILEEGFSMEQLWRITQSVQLAARAANVQIVTGDTKVVDHGKGDGIYINTAGVGIIEHQQRIGPRSVQPGDVIIISGDIGRHGIALMAQREGLEFDTTIHSDSAPVADVVMQLLDAQITIHCLRDLTRGGLASALVEIAESAQQQIEIEEAAIPVQDGVRGACEILGFDPIYVANEGRFIAFVPADDAQRALSIIQNKTPGKDAAMIGHVQAAKRGRVTMRSVIGTSRVIDMLSGEQLPRIC